MTESYKAPLKNIGIIGTGHLAGFLVEGLANTKRDCQFFLSPRNTSKALKLADSFGATIANNNQDVVDRSDLVIISVLPSQANDVVGSLTFEPHHCVLSAMAGVSYDQISELVAPAKAACTMMPGLSNSLGIGPSILHPSMAAAENFLGALGPVHVIDDWDTYQTASTFGGFSGNTFIFMKQIIDWFIAQNLDEETARQLVAETLRGNAEAILQSPLSMEELISSIATSGGITEYGATSLEQHGADKAWKAALNAINNKIKNT